METMAAVDKAHDKEGAEAMKEDAIPTVGNWKSLFDQGDVDNVEPTVIEVTVGFEQHDCTWTKPNILTFSISL